MTAFQRTTTIPCAACEAGLAPADVVEVGDYPVCQGCFRDMAHEVSTARRSRRLVKVVGAQKQIAGVCAGLADYCNMERDTFRVLFFLACFMTGIVPLVLAYVILAFALPEGGA